MIPFKQPVSHQPQVTHEYHVNHQQQQQPIYNQQAQTPSTAQVPLKSALKKPLPSSAQSMTEPVATTTPGGYQKGNEFVPV